MLELTSEFKPSPDQQEAIKGIVKSIKKGNKYQTLLGVTEVEKPLPWQMSLKNLICPLLS